MTDTPVLADPSREEPLGRDHLPGDSHMWIMVVGDLVIFGAYFLIYMVHRSMSLESFLTAQRHLDVTLGVMNTVVLLTSSLLVARGVAEARSGRFAHANRLIYAAGGCGLLCRGVRAGIFYLMPYSEGTK